MPPVTTLLSRRLLCSFILALSALPVRPALAVDVSRLWPTAGSGAVVREERVVGGFQSLKLGTGARVVVRQGNEDSVWVAAEANVQPLIYTYVENGSLVVEDRGRFKSSSAEVIVTVRQIDSIATTGSVAVVAEGLNVPALTLRMGGSSAVRLGVLSAARLHVALGGSSALKVGGTAGDFSSELGGSASLQADALAAKSVSVSGGGSAQAVVWATESLRIAVSGSAGVRHYGVASPTQATSGSATVRYLGAAPPK